MKLNSTPNISQNMRNKAIKIDKKAISITNFNGSEQEKDLTLPANCNGFGRVRHFNLDAGKEWLPNPIPILPAAKALGIPAGIQIKAQLFQNSVCNWRCWYCFVDNRLLTGNPRYSSFLTCEELLELYLQEKDPAPMIDLSGGQPDLTPEWVVWMMQALKDRGLDKKVFLWSDDNLSCDYLWRYLNNEQIDLLSSYEMYSRVCCFKGIDEDTFSLNTKAEPNLFLNQFELCKKLLEINLDLYCYITLTAKTDTNFEYLIPTFFDRIQKIDTLLPLRIVPLRIFEYGTLQPRMKADLFNGQFIALRFWMNELKKRYTEEQLNLPITDVKLKKY